MTWTIGDGLKGCVWLEPLGGTTSYLGSLAVNLDGQKGGLDYSLLTAGEHWLHDRGGDRFGTPLRSDLAFVVLEKALRP